ncbi:MAG: ABC transporter substrate-binding protein [Lacrimispora celerecrescens]|uniref:ABC transporter substrate-binding protein n=1 Tax=Lacrimispora indolis TaxID=69825 RepID=UPI000402470D|nr:ABC transporter substrate-binding protein [[Clostridium] methoxybenzovorans]MBE7721071.1 ABC transporter substrate-binding protein [Lacrimispora celerecrescens]
MKKHSSLLLALILSAGLLSACSNGSQPQKSSAPGQSESTGAPNSSVSQAPGISQETSWPRTITDAGGHEITLALEPRRIAILHSNYLEYFFALGTPVTASAGASVGTAQQALETYETLIPYDGTAEIMDLGSAREISLEAVLESRPDVIVTFAGHTGLDEIYDQLSQIAPVVLLDFSDTWQNQTRACGNIVGREEAAEEIIKKTQDAISSAHEVLSAKDKTAAIFRTNGGKAFVARGSRQYYDAFGLTPPKGYTFGYETFSLEAVAEMNPDYIIFMDYIDIAKGFVKSLEASSVWLNMDAVKNGNVVYFDDSLNTFGPLAMGLTAEKLVNTIK